MSLETAMPYRIKQLTNRYGAEYRFTTAGEGKWDTNEPDAETILVRGVLMAQGRTVQLRQHSMGSADQTTSYRLYTADPHAQQITVQHSIHVEGASLYAVQSVRQPVAKVPAWIISLTA